MTLDRQRKECERAQKTLRHFSVLFSFSILHEIPVDLNGPYKN